MLKKLLILFACTLIFTFFTKCETTANNNEDSTTIGDMKSSTGAKDLDVKKIIHSAVLKFNKEVKSMKYPTK